MVRPPSWPTSHDKCPSSPATSSLSFRAVLFCFILLLCSYLPPSAFAQSVSSLPFLSDQPRHFTTLSANHTTRTYQLSVQYTSQLVIVTSNASTFYASLSAIPSVLFDVGASSPSDTSRALLLGQSYYHSNSFVGQCGALDTNQTGLCNVTLHLADEAGSTVFYSIYTASIVQYNTAYINTGVSGSVSYYAHYVQSGDLNVLFDLSWVDSAGTGQQVPLYTVLLVASEHEPFTLLYPSAGNNVSEINPYSDQSYVASATATGFQPGVYIVALWSGSNAYPSSSLMLTPNFQSDADAPPTTGYTTVLSVMALILSCSVAAIILFRVCILCRRRRNQLIVMSRAEVAMLEPPSGAPPVVYTGGVLRQQQLGATEAEIAALPETVYVRVMGSEGDEPEDPRCTICLDEYETHASRITTLRCGHTFHTSCVHSWLRQRRYCPLCLQIIDRAHDVKKDRQPNISIREVELVEMSSGAYSRPTSVASFSRPTTASDAASSGSSLSRPINDTSGAQFRHWDDEDVLSLSAMNGGTPLDTTPSGRTT